MRRNGNDLVLGAGANGRPIILSGDQRGKHLYVTGATGTGKSKFLENLIRQDIRNWWRKRCGIMVIDKHGELFDSLMPWMASAGLGRLPLVPIDLRRDDWIVSYNVLRNRPTGNPSVIVGAIARAIIHAWGQEDMDDTPRMGKWLTTTLATLYEEGHTLMDALHLFAHPEMRQAMATKIKDFAARHVWGTSTQLRLHEFHMEVESTVNRLLRFLNNPVMRASLCQTGPSLDLGEALQSGSIILVSLATAGTQVDDEDARTFGSMLLSDLWTAAKARGKRGEGHDAVKPFYTYIDEFQDYVTPVMAQTLDQARGFGLHMTLAHQYPSQLSGQGELGQRVFDSVMANTRTKVVFQLDHPEDLPMLALWLGRNQVDLDEIKHQQTSRKVMDYELTYMPSYSRSTSGGTTEGTGRTKSSAFAVGHSTSRGTASSTGHVSGSGMGNSTGASWVDDPNDMQSGLMNDLAITRSQGTSGLDSSSDSEAFSESYAESESTVAMTGDAVSESQSRSQSRSEGISESPMLMPVMGNEPGPPQFRSIEEQLFRFTQKLAAQLRQHAVVRLEGTVRAEPFVVPLVKPGRITAKYVGQWTINTLRKIPFALPMHEALRRLEDRQSHFVDQVSVNPSNLEPTRFKRRISTKLLPQQPPASPTSDVDPSSPSA